MWSRAEETCDLDGAYAACKQVFGIIAMARAVPCDKDEGGHSGHRQDLSGGRPCARPAASRWRAKRADKTFPMSSIQLSQWVGGELHEAYPHLKVDVHHPELTVYVEVREDAAYVHAPRRARRRRPAHRYGRPGGEPALRRHRLPGGQLHDGQAWRSAGDDPLRLPSLYQ